MWPACGAADAAPGSFRRYSASRGIGAWLGTPDGPAAQVDRPGVHERCRGLLRSVSWRASLSSSRCADAVLGGGVGQRARPPRPRPAAIHQRRRRSPAGSPVQPNTPAPQKIAEDGRRQEGVAGVDRQPDRREGGEDDHRQHARRGARQGPAAQPRTGDSTPPSGRSDEHRRAQHLADPSRDVLGHVRDPRACGRAWRRCGGCWSATTTGCPSRAGRCRARSAVPAAASSVRPTSSRRRSRTAARPGAAGDRAATAGIRPIR